jgi:hypothetical protein
MDLPKLGAKMGMHALGSDVRIEYIVAVVLVLGIVFVEEIDVFENLAIRSIVSVILAMNIVFLSIDSPSLALLCAILLIMIHVVYTKKEIWPSE